MTTLLDVATPELGAATQPWIATFSIELNGDMPRLEQCDTAHLGVDVHVDGHRLVARALVDAAGPDHAAACARRRWFYVAEELRLHVRYQLAVEPLDVHALLSQP